MRNFLIYIYLWICTCLLKALIFLVYSEINSEKWWRRKHWISSIKTYVYNFIVLLNQNLATKRSSATVEKTIQIFFEKMNPKVTTDEMIFWLINFWVFIVIIFISVLQYQYFNSVLSYVPILQIKKFFHYLILSGIRKHFIHNYLI